MSALAKLKLVNSKRSRTVSPIVHRRNKLVAKIAEQIELATAQKEGRLYAPKKLKNVTNADTGERRTIETTKRVKEWFWIGDTGKINLAIKYGAKTLPLNKKGANAIELMNGTALIGTLHKLKEAVIAGEFDDAISEVSDATRKAFKK